MNNQRNIESIKHYIELNVAELVKAETNSPEWESILRALKANVKELEEASDV